MHALRAIPTAVTLSNVSEYVYLYECAKLIKYALEWFLIRVESRLCVVLVVN